MTVRARIIEIVSLATAINYPTTVSGGETPKIAWGYDPYINRLSVIISKSGKVTRYFVDCTKHKAYDELGEIIGRLESIKEG